MLEPDKLTDDELCLVRQHVSIGASILADGTFPVLRLARQIALTHHERWDGTGYLNRLASEAIPLAGRIVAVADVFDALMNGRAPTSSRRHPQEPFVRM